MKLYGQKDPRHFICWENDEFYVLASVCAYMSDGWGRLERCLHFYLVLCICWWLGISLFFFQLSLYFILFIYFFFRVFWAIFLRHYVEVKKMKSIYRTTQEILLGVKSSDTRINDIFGDSLELFPVFSVFWCLNKTVNLAQGYVAKIFLGFKKLMSIIFCACKGKKCINILLLFIYFFLNFFGLTVKSANWFSCFSRDIMWNLPVDWIHS